MGKTFLTIFIEKAPATTQDLGGSLILRWPPGLAKQDADTTHLEHRVICKFTGDMSGYFPSQHLRFVLSASFQSSFAHPLELLTLKARCARTIYRFDIPEHANLGADNVGVERMHWQLGGHHSLEVYIAPCPAGARKDGYSCIECVSGKFRCYSTARQIAADRESASRLTE